MGDSGAAVEGTFHCQANGTQAGKNMPDEAKA
jgi:hypothetical protein